MLNVIFIGDFGGIRHAPYTTAKQLFVRDRMENVASTHNITAIVSVGDNFYVRGVKNEYDPRFSQTFENVYNTTHLLHIPWYVIAGDHDWKGNVSAQIEYTKHSSRWNMPYYYHNKLWSIPNSAYTLEIVLIDTIILCRSSNHILIEAQYSWFQHTLLRSNATYIIVVGHLPIYSYSWHGPNGCLSKLNDILMKHNDKIIAYICGHDHNLQFIEMQQQMTQYIVSGAGSTYIKRMDHLNNKHNPNWMDHFRFKGGVNGGFVRLELLPSCGKMYFYEGLNDSVAFSSGIWYPNGTYIRGGRLYKNGNGSNNGSEQMNHYFETSGYDNMNVNFDFLLVSNDLNILLFCSIGMSIVMIFVLMRLSKHGKKPVDIQMLNEKNVLLNE